MPRGRATKRGRPPPTPRKGTYKKRKTSLRSKKARSANNILTEQRDFRVDYVAPKKRGYNKSMKRFAAKVEKVMAKKYPCASKVYSVASNSTVTTTATIEQVYQVFHLKPWQGTAAAPGAGTLYIEPAQTDINDIATELQAAGLSGNFVTQYAQMDIYLHNNQGTADIFVDVYELDYVKKDGDPISAYASFQAALTAATTQITVVGNAYSLNRNGVTPFDIATMIQDFGIKVTKKSTIVMKADDTSCYKVPDYKRHTFDLNALTNGLSGKFCIQGKTRTVLCVGRPASNDAVSGFRAYAIKRYSIKPMYDKNDEVLGGHD